MSILANSCVYFASFTGQKERKKMALLSLSTLIVGNPPTIDRPTIPQNAYQPTELQHLRLICQYADRVSDSKTANSDRQRPIGRVIN